MGFRPNVVRKYEFKLGSSWDFNYQNLELCEWLRKYKVDVTGGGEDGEGTRWELWKKQLRKIPARAYKDKDFPGLDPKELKGFVEDCLDAPTGETAFVWWL